MSSAAARSTVRASFLPSEVRPVRATPLHQLRCRPGEHALAPVAEDARPGAGHERDVELPGSLLVGVVEADPLVGVGRDLRVRVGHAFMMTGVPADRDDPRPVLTMTTEARVTVTEALANETGHGRLALWLEVTGANDGAYTYDMYFRALHDATPGTSSSTTTTSRSSSHGRASAGCKGPGSTWLTDADGEVGLVVVNPNRPPTRAEQGLAPAEATPADLTSPLARRVASVLESEVNPSIAEHGGRADLVTVEGSVVHLRLSGGCQGCGMAQATLTQGIEAILREAVPEITDIVDVTNHAAGSNPFYQSAQG